MYGGQNSHKALQLTCSRKTRICEPTPRFDINIEELKDSLFFIAPSSGTIKTLSE